MAPKQNINYGSTSQRLMNQAMQKATTTGIGFGGEPKAPVGGYPKNINPVVNVIHPPTVHENAQAFIKNMRSQGYAISTDKGRIQALKPGQNVKYFTFPN